MKNKQKQRELKSAFEAILAQLRPVPKKHLAEAMQIMQEDSLYDLFDYLIEIKCFPEHLAKQMRTYLAIELFDYEINENYSELNNEKYTKFLDALQLKKD